MERDLGQGLRLKVDGSTTGTKYYICNDGPDEWVAGDDRQRLFRIDSEERVGLPLVLRNLATGKVIAVTLPCS